MLDNKNYERSPTLTQHSQSSQWRINLFAATCASICLVAVYCLFDPTAGKRQETAFVFPDRIPLKSWQAMDTELLSDRRKDIAGEEEHFNSGKRYSYRQNGIPLEIEMRYLVGTRGNVGNAIEQQTSIPAKLFEKGKVRQIDGIGFYTLFADRNRAYLGTCINSRGGSTVNMQQFSKNRYAYDLKYNLFVPWLLGKETLRDRRCLWTQMSIPTNSSNLETAEQILKTAWIDWYRWWQPRFPKL
jgi:cyanosortase A-associated protein